MCLNLNSFLRKRFNNPSSLSFPLATSSFSTQLQFRAESTDIYTCERKKTLTILTVGFLKDAWRTIVHPLKKSVLIILVLYHKKQPSKKHCHLTSSGWILGLSVVHKCFTAGLVYRNPRKRKEMSIRRWILSTYNSTLFLPFDFIAHSFHSRAPFKRFRTPFIAF